ncbi:hypothetical protein Hanom_Chr09g00811631 [Helianthus anomalus]
MGESVRKPGPIQLDSAEQFPPLGKSGPTAVSSKIGAEKNLGCFDSRGPTMVAGSSAAEHRRAGGSQGPNIGMGNILKDKNPMMSMVDNLSERSKGSGFFDVSKNNFGPRQSPILETKNMFGKLQDEEECFDTEYVLW